MIRAGSMVLVCLLLSSTLSSSAGGATAEERAHEELEKGYALRKEGKCAEALPLLQDSYRLAPLLKTLINLADCEEKLGKLPPARAHWATAQEEASAKGEIPIADEAGRRVAALEARLSKVTLRSALPAGATVTLDGATVDDLSSSIWIGAGAHEVIVRAPEREPRSHRFVVAEGERRTLEIAAAEPRAKPSDAAPSNDGSTLRTAGWVTLGVAGAALVTGTFFGARAISRKGDANCPANVCGPSSDPDALRDALRAGRVSTVLFVAGGLLAAGSVTLLVVAPRDRAQVVLSPTGLSLRGSF